MSETSDRHPLPRGPLPAKRECAYTVFFDADDRMLLLKLSSEADEWVLPGGVSEPDESPRLTTLREVEEEIGLVKEPGALLVIDWERSRGRILTASQRTAGWSERFLDGLMLFFDGGVLTPEEIAAIRLDPAEIKEYAFVPLGQAVELLDAVRGRRAIAAVQARQTGCVLYLEDGHPPG